MIKPVSGPGLNSSPPEAKNPRVFHGSATTFQVGVSSGILQDKVRMLGALVLCSPSEHIFCYTLLTLQRACVNEWHALCGPSVEPCSAVPGWPHIQLMTETCRVFIPTCQCQEVPNISFWDRPEMGKMCGPNSAFSVKLSGLFYNFITSWELEVLT